MDTANKAIEIKHNGNNCCQAVLLAYANQLALPEDTLKRIGAPFGLGMGNMQGQCGALCAAQMVISLSSNSPTNAKAIQNAFIDKAGSSICKELKGVGTNQPPLCSCDNCVRIAVEIVENAIK